MEAIPKSLNRRSVSIAASLGLLFTSAIWGFAFVVVKDSLDYIGAVYMIAFRFTLAAMITMIIFSRKLRLINRKYLWHGLITGIFLFMAYTTQTIGCDHTTAGKNAFLTTTYVILIPMISWILYKKRPGWHIFTAAALTITGIGLLSLKADDTAGLNIGDVLTLICGIFYALHIVWTARYNEQREDPLLLTALQFTCCAILGWLLAPFYDGDFPVSAIQNSRVIFSVLYLGLFSTMVAFSLQNLGLKFVQPTIASLLLSFESVFGILFSTWLLHEAMTMKTASGCMLIFTAVILAETKFQFRKNR